jgi:hypothetical protein
VAVPDQHAPHGAALLQRPDRRVHALGGDARAPGEIRIGQVGPVGEVAERAEVPQREPERGQLVVDAALQEPARPDEHEDDGRRHQRHTLTSHRTILTPRSHRRTPHASGWLTVRLIDEEAR